MITLLLIGAGVMVAAVVVTLVALRRAPDGFEDPAGWHRAPHAEETDARAGQAGLDSRSAGPSSDSLSPLPVTAEKLPGGALLA